MFDSQMITTVSDAYKLLRVFARLHKLPEDVKTHIYSFEPQGPTAVHCEPCLPWRKALMDQHYSFGAKQTINVNGDDSFFRLLLYFKSRFNLSKLLTVLNKEKRTHPTRSFLVVEDYVFASVFNLEILKGQSVALVYHKESLFVGMHPPKEKYAKLLFVCLLPKPVNSFGWLVLFAPDFGATLCDWHPGVSDSALPVLKPSVKCQQQKQRLDLKS